MTWVHFLNYLLLSYDIVAYILKCFFSAYKLTSPTANKIHETTVARYHTLFTSPYTTLCHHWTIHYRRICSYTVGIHRNIKHGEVKLATKLSGLAVDDIVLRHRHFHTYLYSWNINYIIYYCICWLLLLYKKHGQAYSWMHSTSRNLFINTYIYIMYIIIFNLMCDSDYIIFFNTYIVIQHWYIAGQIIVWIIVGITYTNNLNSRFKVLVWFIQNSCPLME